MYKLDAFFVYGGVIASMIFYATCVVIAKKIKNNEDTWNSTILGSFMLGFIIYSLMVILGR